MVTSEDSCRCENPCYRFGYDDECVRMWDTSSAGMAPDGGGEGGGGGNQIEIAHTIMLFGNANYRFSKMPDKLARQLGERGIWRTVVEYAVSRDVR